MKDHSYYLYILASKRNGTLYIGMTSNLTNRVLQHKLGYFSGFTKKYKIHKLVFYEETNDVYAALLREKQIKKWKRAWKIRIIEENNPNWDDLSKDWFSMEDIEEYRQGLEK
jgi:putative endonuclease